MSLRSASVWLALCALLTGTASAWALAPHDKAVGVHAEQIERSRSTLADDAAEAQADERGTANRPFIVKTIGPEKSPDEAAKDARDRKNKRWNDGATIFISGITVLVLLAQSGVLLFQAVLFRRQAKSLRDTIITMRRVGNRQSRDMRDSIAAARAAAEAASLSNANSRQSFIVQNRPWVRIEVEITERKNQDDSTTLIFYEIHVENIGNTPAIDVLIEDGSAYITTEYNMERFKETREGVFYKFTGNIPARHQKFILLPSEKRSMKGIAHLGEKYAGPIRDGSPVIPTGRMIVCCFYRSSLDTSIYETSKNYSIGEPNPAGLSLPLNFHLNGPVEFFVVEDAVR